MKTTRVSMHKKQRKIPTEKQKAGDARDIRVQETT